MVKKWTYTSGWETKSKAKQVAESSRKRGLMVRVVSARKSTIASAKHPAPPEQMDIVMIVI